MITFLGFHELFGQFFFPDQFGEELEEAIYRFPLGDNGDDDLDLMIQYPDEAAGLGHNHIEERMARAIHLPLWSDMMHQGKDHINEFSFPGVTTFPWSPLRMSMAA